MLLVVTLTEEVSCMYVTVPEQPERQCWGTAQPVTLKTRENKRNIFPIKK